ncbi:hypothetical protein GH714_031670 [Hevea brasiliensis]|uniref:Ubiquitin-like domain-containing protein n=1 Tax=Hevea brasiliensis TaxID=3981 RepID=A0A6A6LD54_HEVBR|nr:hypothetical protein GH714_031670 [Hevea brasiliensis]
MAGVQDQLEIKFRLTDGSDIGPKTFAAATSVATLKESILAQWPKEKENGPTTVKDVKLISAGKILENNRTVGECQSPLCDIPGGVTTMHVIVQPSSLDKGKEFGDGLDSKAGELLILMRDSGIMHIYLSLNNPWNSNDIISVSGIWLENACKFLSKICKFLSKTFGGISS